MRKPCPLCDLVSQKIVWVNNDFTVIDAQYEDLPGYVRIISKRHVKEMSELSESERKHLWRILQPLELSIIRDLQPTKVNLAEFGNEVPHLHWHLIPRWVDDPFFPGSIWSPRQRKVDANLLAQRKKKAQVFFTNLPIDLNRLYSYD